MDIDKRAYVGNKEMALKANTYIDNSAKSFNKFIDNINEGIFANNLIFGIGITAIYNIANHSSDSELIAKASKLGINHFIDDSPSLWGAELLGAEIIGSDQIQGLTGDSQVFISANPCYHDKMIAKLVRLGIKHENIFK